jgi:hypothetical protein
VDDAQAKLAGGSGTGGSFEGDYNMCERFHYWKHRRGLDLPIPPDFSALTLGTAFHKGQEIFYIRQFDGVGRDECVDAACDAFSKMLAELLEQTSAVIGDSLDDAKMNTRAKTALAHMRMRLPKQWDRMHEGKERTVALPNGRPALEMHLTLQLPESIEIPGYGVVTIRPELRHFTVQIDRVAEVLNEINEQWWRTVIDFKSTASKSAQQVAGEYHSSDQHVGYSFVYNQQPNVEPIMYGDYRVWRIEGPIETAAAYAEDPRLLRPEVVNEWYTDLIVRRARQSSLWDLPKVMWIKRKHTRGPCHIWGKECRYWALCDAPDSDEQKIADGDYVTVE